MNRLSVKADSGAGPLMRPWVRMRLRWLSRADMKRNVTTLSRTAKNLTFIGQPQLSLGSQPIEKLRPVGPQPTHQRGARQDHSAGDKVKGYTLEPSKRTRAAPGHPAVWLTGDLQNPTCAIACLIRRTTQSRRTRQFTSSREHRCAGRRS